MLKHRWILVVFLSLILATPCALASINDNTFILVIDPGHGGKDAGAVGRKAKEKDINLAVSLLVGQYISNEHPDVKIIYTRKRDVFIGLNERANIANEAKANLFISIHTNAVDRGKKNVYGAETFTFGLSRTAENMEVAKRENKVILMEENYEQKYEGFDPESSESYIIFEFMQNKFVEQSVNFASLVQHELVHTSKRYNRGVKQAEYLVLRKSSLPRVLIELDFISNYESEKYLSSKEGQRSMAKAICNAFSKYKKEYDRKSGITSTPNKGRKTRVAEEPIADLPNDIIFDNDPETDTKSIKRSDSRTAVKEKPITQKKSKRVYKVQILTSDKKLSAKSPKLKGYKADYYMEKKLYKYTYGETSDWSEILKIRRSLLKDFKDAFIITFEDGVRVPNK